MSQQMVKVRSKKDRNDVREMTEKMYAAISEDWEIVYDDSEGSDSDDRSLEALKKKAVGGAGGELPVEVMTFETPITSEQFVTVIDSNEGPTLAQQYELLAGKAPDKRWKEARIQSEIEKLKQ